MSPESYRARIARLGLTQEAAGELLGVTGRTGQTWAADGPPLAVAMLLLAVDSRAELEELAQLASVKSCNNS